MNSINHFRQQHCHPLSSPCKPGSSRHHPTPPKLPKFLVALSLFILWGLHGCQSRPNGAISQTLPIGGAQPIQTPAVSKAAASPLDHQTSPSSPDPTTLPFAAIRGFCHPLQGKGFLSQGTREGTHQGRMEYAYDFGAPVGLPVYAMRGGRVIGLRDIYPDDGGGKQNADKFNFIWLEHSNGVRSVYIHLQQNFRQRLRLRVNDWVRTGQLIGFSGNSGWSSAPHLHVEVHRINNTGFGQTLPFVIASNCYAQPIAKVE